MWGSKPKRAPRGIGRLERDFIGYARVSTADQSLDAQRLALGQCSRIFTDTATGKHIARPGLSAALEYLRAGDTLVIWRLDRLGRNLKGLIDLYEQLDARKIALHSLSEGLDTSTAAGRFAFHMLAALAQMERELIVERTRAGLAAARIKHGLAKIGGRPLAMTAAKVASARVLFAAGATVAQVAGALGVSQSSLFRHIPADDRQGKIALPHKADSTWF